jgi:hypothetical protein
MPDLYGNLLASGGGHTSAAALRPRRPLIAAASLLGRVFGAFRKKGPAPATTDGFLPLAGDAVGLITSHADTQFPDQLCDYLLSLGLKSYVFVGPLSGLEDPRPAWDRIQRGEMRWVYGKQEPLRVAPEAGNLRAGDLHAVVNGVLFSYFLPDEDGSESVRFCDYQWPPPGRPREGSLARLSAETEERLVVVGSGIEYELWAAGQSNRPPELLETDTHYWMSSENRVISLEPDIRQIIVCPTCRMHRCSIIEPSANRMVLINR